MRRFILVSIKSDNEQASLLAMSEIRKQIHSISERYHDYQVQIGDFPISENQRTHFAGGNATADFVTLSEMYDRIMNRAIALAQKLKNSRFK